MYPKVQAHCLQSICYNFMDVKVQVMDPLLTFHVWTQGQYLYFIYSISETLSVYIFCCS